MSGAVAETIGRLRAHVPGFVDVPVRKVGEGLAFVFASARVLGVTLASAGMILLLMRSMLYVRTGWGVEDFMGWADEGAAGPSAALLELWQHCQVLWLAKLYMALDSIAFVPIYAAFFLRTGGVLARALDDDTGRPTPAGRRWFAVFWVPVLMLVAVDLLENLAGLARTGGYGVLMGSIALALGVAGVLGLAWLDDWKIRAHRGALVLGLLLLALLLAGMFFWTEACAAVDGANWRGRLGCAAHHSKSWLTVVVLGVLVAAGICWLFGVVLSTHTDVAGNPERALRRADLRAAIFDCLVRSRYVLAALALLAGLTVVMDQSRDIIASTASFVPRFFTMVQVDWGGAPAPVPGTPVDWGGVLWLLAGSLTVFGLSILGLALLVFACWLWTRSVCHLRSAGQRPAKVGFEAAHDGDRHEDIFARDWARVLALVPVLLVVLLCANVLQDLAKAQTGMGAHAGAGAGWLACLLPSVGVVAFAALAVFAGGWFIWRRGDRESTGGYYDCIDWREWSERAGLLEVRAHASTVPSAGSVRPADLKYHFLGKITPYLLPMVALGLVFLCRLVDVLPGRSGDYFPSMAFPVILLSLTFWLCFFGWLSLLEVHGAVPWVLVLIVWVGVLGLAGLTDNHIVWPGPLPGEPSAWGGMRMLACSAVLGGVLVVAYRWAMERVRHPGSGASLRVYWPLVLLVPTLTIAIMVVGNNFATARRPQRPAPPPQASAAAVQLDAALAGWLRTLCHAPDDKSACAPQLAPHPATGGYDVYFVSSEGGGIRAAMWTAFALHQLQAEDPGFAQRTFSISGVSGGAVGAAVYRACSAGSQASEREACIRRFAQTDLLSPLLSSWMFEDLLGRLVPSGLCNTPGCGFMTRGAWFEQAMEVGAPRLRRGLRELRSADTTGANAGRHVPYLLLNATWVETGERAIATELVVSQADFPGSKDQLGLVGADMPLGAAAHNAARFPYVNAIGGLKTPAYLCDRRGAAAPGAAGKNPPDAEIKICGHLADGGYFDNGGAQSTTDLVRAFVACLAARDAKADAPTTECGKLPEGQRTWLRENLVPRALMIRNESNPGAADQERCGVITRPQRADVIPVLDSACTTPIGKRYQPARPLCAKGKVPYLDLIGPLLAVINTSGVGAAGRLAEAREADAIVQARIAMRGKAAAAAIEPVTAIELLPKGVHFPLGWHLSLSGVNDMSAQAANCRILPAADKP